MSHPVLQLRLSIYDSVSNQEIKQPANAILEAIKVLNHVGGWIEFCLRPHLCSVEANIFSLFVVIAVFVVFDSHELHELALLWAKYSIVSLHCELIFLRLTG